MKLTNLSARPDKYQDTLTLIEKEFNYSDEFSFEIDFYPLVKPSNRENLFILLNENDEVVAHLGVLEKSFKLGAKTFKCSFIGGVVVRSDYQGKGLSRKLMEHIEENCKDYTFTLLWSDKTEYYKKFNYYPCIQQNQYEQTNCKNDYKRVVLNDSLISKIRTLYNSNQEHRPIRTDQDWNDLKKITSMEVYIKGDINNPHNYFFLNKGQDLTGIIHEYGSFDENMLNFGNLWSPYEANNLAPTYQYAALLKINNFASFKEFVLSYSQNLIKINDIDDYRVSFQFGAEEFDQSIEDFLTGLLGPSRYEELNELKNLFIPGVDSI
jgi:predicted N-acetyltransferase YhbS